VVDVAGGGAGGGEGVVGAAGDAREEAGGDAVD